MSDSPLLPIPGPRGHWLWGHFPELKHDSLATFTQMKDQFGDILRIPMWGMGGVAKRYDLYILSNPDDIAYVLDRNSANYPNAGLLRERYITLFGPCILGAKGADWKRRRKLEAPAFSRARLFAISDRLIEETERVADRWDAHLDKGNPQFNAVPDIMEMALRMAGRMFFSTDFEGVLGILNAEREIMFKDMNAVCFQENTPVLKKFSTPARRRFGRSKSRVDRVMLNIVKERRAAMEAESQNDLLDILIGARDANGIGWKDTEIAGEIHTVVRAGQDTTAASLTWALLMIARHPHVEAKLLAELDEVLEGRTIQSADLADLPYLKAIYDETLRLYPPIPVVARVAEKEDEIRGMRVPAGSYLVSVPWLAQRDGRWWEDAATFNPDRFLGGVRHPDRPKYAYFPFGGGTRFCLGAGLALLQGPLILATLLRRFKIEVPADFAGYPIPGISVMPDGGLPIILKRREASQRQEARGEGREVLLESRAAELQLAN